jgi:hypothetical protein
MRRKLVNFEVFDRIEQDSLSQAEYELHEASNVLADALESGPLSFRFFDNGKVVYDTAHGSYIHANYQITNEAITFDDITELVVDTESQRKRLRECVTKMVDAIIDGNETEANLQFEKYMRLFTDARKSGVTQMSESDEVVRFDSRQGKIVKWGHGGPKSKGGFAAGKSAKQKLSRRKRNSPTNKSKEMNTRHKNKIAGIYKKIRLINNGSSEKKMMKEWYNLCENLRQYVDFVQHSHNTQNIEVKTNDVGDVVSVKIPTSKVRNEGKILTLQYKTLKTDVKVLREAARTLAFDENFIKAVAKIKRLNNMSHNQELEESISELVSRHPNVLYLTQDELAQTVKRALDNAGQSNFDDQTCQFMAEGILRVAHDAFTDRVNRIVHLANAKVTTEGEVDAYEQFQAVVKRFYPQLDEAMATEMQVYTDLYNALVEVRRLALANNNDTLREEATGYLTELKAVLEGQKVPTLDLAVDVSEFLQTIVEANVDGASEDWNVSNSAYTTVVGDHPILNKKAKQPGHPGSYTGDWGDSAPASDGKTYKGGEADQMRNHGWGNKGGKDTWPSLNNPYVPKPFGDYTMKGEPGVDKNHDSGFSQMHGDTWPELQNPYVPKSISVWKMKSDNLIVDKGTGSLPSGPGIGADYNQKVSV